MQTNNKNTKSETVKYKQKTSKEKIPIQSNNG